MLGRNAGHGWCCFGPCLKSGRGVQVRERRGFHLLIYVTPLNPAPSGQPGQSGNVYCWGVEPPSDILARDLEVRARGSPTRCCPGPGPRGQGAHLQQHKPIQRIFKKTARIQRRLCAVIPFNKSVSKHYCGGWMKSFILLLHMYFWVDIIHSPQRSQ